MPSRGLTAVSLLTILTASTMAAPATKAPPPMSAPVRLMCSATAAITATCAVHPLDVIRVRMQVDTGGKAAATAAAAVARKANMFSTAGLIWRTGGIVGMYAGIQAGIARQLTYGMPRMTIFTMGMDRLSNGGESPWASGRRCCRAPWRAG